MDLRPEDIDETAKPLITVTQRANGKWTIIEKLNNWIGKFYVHNDTVTSG